MNVTNVFKGRLVQYSARLPYQQANIFVKLGVGRKGFHDVHTTKLRVRSISQKAATPPMA